MAAIVIENSSIAFERIEVQASDVGVRSINSHISIPSATFENVTQPWDISGGSADIAGSRISRDPKIRRGPNKSQVGWTPTPGPAMPAQCPQCGSIFPSVNYKVQLSRFYSRDNEEVCPVCKFEHAKVADGIFDLAKEAIHILAGPETSLAMLKAIAEIAKSTAAEKIEPASAVAEFEQVSPKLATVVSRALAVGRHALVYVTFAIGFAALEQAERHHQENTEQTERHHQEKTEQAERHHQENTEQTERNHRENTDAAKYLLEQTLEALSRFTIELTQNQRNEDDATPGRGPADSETPAETGPIELQTDGSGYRPDGV